MNRYPTLESGYRCHTPSSETLGHRGRKHDPLDRNRRLLSKGQERLDEAGEARLLALFKAGDPRGEVRSDLAR